MVLGGEQAPAKGTEELGPGLRRTWCVCEGRGARGRQGLPGQEQLLYREPWQGVVCSVEGTHLRLELFMGAWEAPVWWRHWA